MIRPVTDVRAGDVIAWADGSTGVVVETLPGEIGHVTLYGRSPSGSALIPWVWAGEVVLLARDMGYTPRGEA